MNNDLIYQFGVQPGVVQHRTSQDTSKLKSAILISVLVGSTLVPLEAPESFTYAQNAVYSPSIFSGTFSLTDTGESDIDLGDAFMKNEIVIFKHFTYDKKVYNLKDYISGSVVANDGIFIIENEPLNIRSFGSTRAESEAAFVEELAFLHKNYVLEDDSKLSRGAKNLKRKLILYFS